MIKPCDAVWLNVAAIWSAAALASFQSAEAEQPTSRSGAYTFDFSQEFDVDAALALGNREGSLRDLVVDARYRLEAEQVLASGRRWGFRGGLSANSGDGRRGFSRLLMTGPVVNGQALTGLATGFSAASLDAGSGQIELTQAEVFLKTNWLEVSLGQGETALRSLAEPPIAAFRLAGADRPIADLVGGGLSHTGLSLTAPAPRVAFETRRLIGLSVTGSYTPEAARCGIEICRPAESVAFLSPDVEHVVAIAASFDRRSPSSGVRWQARLGAERASVDRTHALYEDPWIVTAGVSREHEGLTLSTSALLSNDGLDGGDFSSVSATAALERGDWLYSAQIAHGDSQVFDLDGSSFSMGASRWVGERTLISFGLIHHEAGGTGAVVETGLRF